MGLLDVEKFVFYKGILGCPLKEIPDNLMHEVGEADTLEIVGSDDLDSLYSLANGSSNTYNVNDIDPEGNFTIKPKYEAWRKIVFNGRNIHSEKITTFCTLAIQHPEGLTKKFVKSRIPNSEKSLSKWIKKLEEADVIYTELASNGVEVIKFNYNLIEKPREIENATAMPAPKAKTKQSSELDIGEMIEKSVEAIRDYPEGMPIRRLRAFLNASSNVLKAVIRKFRDMEGFKVIEKNNTPSKIMFTGAIKTEYIDVEMVKFLLDICRSLRIIVLSEQPKELGEMKFAMGIGDGKLMEILEDNNFKVIEIRHKYINSDFVVFSPDVEDNDEELITAVMWVKDKMARYFRAKIKGIFFNNIYLISLDNNYSPHLKERVMYFYRYVIEQMKNNTMFFFFSNETLLNMSFFSFVRCVSLRTEFHFIEIMVQVGRHLGFSEGITKKQLEALSPEEYDKINAECLEASKNYTLGQVLDMLEDGSETKASLLGRASVQEFQRILLSVVKHNIFKSYSDQEYIYFEKIEGIEKCIDRILTEINDEASDQQSSSVPYPARRWLFDQICEFLPDEFYSKTKELIENTFDGAYKEFFMRKLQNFE